MYADDTFLFGNYTRNINILLQEVERESRYYNMRLNYDKGVSITINRKQLKCATQKARKFHAKPLLDTWELYSPTLLIIQRSLDPE